MESILCSVYEEVMWLAKRPHTTASVARSWYTHCKAVTLSRRVRRFTGKVSVKALEEGAVLRLEHFMRIQTTLTALVERHLAEERNDPAEFVRCVLDCENVHIVTFEENYDAMRNKGDYGLAGIELKCWSEVAPEKQAYLWMKVLRGKVANANEFFPPKMISPSGENIAEEVARNTKLLDQPKS